MTALRLGIPSKGRLMEDTFAYFRACGLKISKTGHSREYAGAAKGIDGIEVVFLQAGEMPAALEAGTIHLGVTGLDMIREKLSDGEGVTACVKPLGFGYADLVVAVPKSWLDVESIADLDDAAAAFRAAHGFPMRVATKYLNSVRGFFREQGVTNYRLLKSDGATEGTPAAGTAEIVVDITSSGETLKANHLKILSDGLILRSQAELRASVTADWSDQTIDTLKTLVQRIEAKEVARTNVLLRCVLPSPLSADLHAAIETAQASLTTEANGMTTICCPSKAAHGLAESLIQSGAREVESLTADMLYTANTDHFDRLRQRLSG